MVNLGIFAHIDAGKTTLTEQILYISGLVSSPGTVEEGTTESDYLKVEIERGISVLSSILQFRCKVGKKEFCLNLIDTPGHLDFRSQVETVLPGIDLAVIVLDASRGVESQTVLIHEILAQNQVPEIFFVNKLDRFPDRLSDSAIAIEELLGFSPSLLLQDGKYAWKNPEAFNEASHLELIQWSEKYSQKYLEDTQSLYTISIQALLEGIWKRKIFPITGGSASLGTGVGELLELIYELEQWKIRNQESFSRKNKDSEVTVLKRMIHPKLGKVSIARSHRRLEQGTRCGKNGIILNSFYKLFGQEAEPLEFVAEGDIFATKDLNSVPILISGEEPGFSLVVEPESLEDKEELIGVLDDLIWEDPSYRFVYNPDSGNYQIWGRGELHLEILQTRLEESLKKKFHFGNITVARYEYLKTMVKKLVLEHTAFGGKFSSGRIVANLRDTADFSKQIAFAVSLPDKIHDAIVAGFHEALSRGNYHLEVLGAFLEVESYEPPPEVTEVTPPLVKVAVVSGIRSALAESTDRIGPVSELEVEVLDSDVGNVLSLLQKRDCKILDIRKKDSGKSLILARAGTENLLGFSGALRNMTKGIGFSLQRNFFDPANYTVLRKMVR